MIEVVLQEIVFSDNKKLTYSLAIEEKEKRNILKWVVSSEGRSENPVMFFNDSELATEEFKRRCGEAAIHGLTVESNDIYGSLRGYFISEFPVLPIKVKKEGYKVVRKSEKETRAWRKSVFKQKTLKLTGG